MKIIHRNIKKTAAITLIAFLFISADNIRKNEKFINPGFRINSEGDDFSPSITADGNIMVFNSKKPEERSYNIFICRKDKGLWGESFPVFELCSDSNDETPFISADGKTILFSSDRPGGFSPPMTADGNKRITFDIYISRFGDGRWSAPVLLQGNVNTMMNERSPSLSRDGKFLFFSRWPYKNFSKSKIFMAELENGKYINPKELPEFINSGNCEIGFIPSYRDNRYYFSSMRNGGMGGWDIYYTTFTKKGFTQPINAGPSINSVFDDLFFSETISDYVMCSNLFGGLGGYDIYVKTTSAKNIEGVENIKTAYSKETQLIFSAVDSLTGKPVKNMPLTIHLFTEREETNNAARKTEVNTDSSGTFTIYPRKDVKWMLIEPMAEEYSGCSMKIKVLPEQYQETALYLKRNPDKKNITAEKVKEKEDAGTSGKTLPPGITVNDEIAAMGLKKIYFDFNSVKIRTENIPDLYSLVEYMRQNNSVTLLLTGYTDSVGSRKINKRISYKRAMSVKNFITGMDIDADRITVKGAGEIHAGDRYHRRGKNQKFRRVDFKIIGTR